VADYGQEIEKQGVSAPYRLKNINIYLFSWTINPQKAGQMLRWKIFDKLGKKEFILV